MRQEALADDLAAPRPAWERREGRCRQPDCVGFSGAEAGSMEAATYPPLPTAGRNC